MVVLVGVLIAAENIIRHCYASTTWSALTTQKALLSFLSPEGIQADEEINAGDDDDNNRKLERKLMSAHTCLLLPIVLVVF